MMQQNINKDVDNIYLPLLENHPFLTYLTHSGNDYIGVIQNVDDSITTIYDYSALRTLDEKTTFLTLAESWWWESNRIIPINVFLKQEWVMFRTTLKTFNSKDVEIKCGPCISLKELALSKSKRRSITLVRRIL